MSKKKEHIPSKPLRFTAFLSKPYWAWAFLSFLLVVVAQLVEVSTYYIFKQIIDIAGMYATGQEAAVAVLLWVLLYPVAVVGPHCFTV